MKSFPMNAEVQVFRQRQHGTAVNRINIRTETDCFFRQSQLKKRQLIIGEPCMRMAQEGVAISEARAKALSLMKVQLERWRNALPINSLGKRKTDIQVLKAYLRRQPLNRNSQAAQSSKTLLLIPSHTR
jgi:hypothetical protein